MKQLSWPGACEHDGHTITAIEQWPTRIINNRVTCGRVRCTCGKEWDVGGWPAEVYDEMMEDRA